MKRYRIGIVGAGFGTSAHLPALLANPRFEVVACIAGRGFKVRREDMKKLILATRGKVFTLQTLARLVDCTRLGDYKTK